MCTGYITQTADAGDPKHWGCSHSSQTLAPPSTSHSISEGLQNANADGREDNPKDLLRGIAKLRLLYMEYAGEFFGTMVFVMFGSSANCQVNLGNNPNISPAISAGNWTSLSLGWGAGLALGVWFTGGHINPAITLALAVWRGFPWRKVPGYMICQLLGAFCGSAIVYGNYIHAINIAEGGGQLRTMKTAGFFGTFPLAYLSNISCFFSEFIGTCLLLFGLLALKDKRNKLTPGLVAFGIFFVFVGITVGFGMQTGFALNPARDLGPRILTSMVGYGRQVYHFRNQYWLWCPVLASFLGAQVGTMLYDVFMYSGHDSLVNKILDRQLTSSNDAEK